MSSNLANFQLFFFPTPQLVAQDRAILLKLTPHRQERLGERSQLELEQNVACGCNALTREPETASAPALCRVAERTNLALAPLPKMGSVGRSTWCSRTTNI